MSPAQAESVQTAAACAEARAALVRCGRRMVADRLAGTPRILSGAELEAVREQARSHRYRSGGG